MKKLKLRSICRRGTAMLLLAATLVGILPGGGVVKEAKADSNSLRETYIQLMAGASAVNVDAIDQLTVNDLRAIALYLSNFYIPYATSIDDTEQQDKNEQHMVNALKNIGFKDDAARSLIKTVYSASLATAKELYIKDDEIYSSNKEFEVATVAAAPTGAVALPTMAIASINKTGLFLGLRGHGGLGFLGSDAGDFGISYDGAEAASFDTTFTSGTSTYYPLTLFAYTALPQAYTFRNVKSINAFGVRIMDVTPKDQARLPIQLYWRDGSTAKPCFVINDFTCTFIKAFADAVDLSDGSGGMSLLSTSFQDFNTLKEKEQKALCSFTQKLYVDWVGNILCDFGDRRVIMYPACMNPYVFDMIGDEVASTDDDSEGPGTEDESDEDGEDDEDTEESEEGDDQADIDAVAYNFSESLPIYLTSPGGELDPTVAEGPGSETTKPTETTETTDSDVTVIDNSDASYIEADNRRTAFSIISTWGMWWMNQSGIECSADDEAFTCDGAASEEAVFDFLAYTGSGTTMKWKDKAVPGSQVAREKIQSWGFHTGKFDGDTWWPARNEVVPEIELPAFSFSIHRDAVLSEFLRYSPVSDNELSLLDNGSVFTTSDYIEVGEKYFTQSNKFTVKSEDFSGYMQFTGTDYDMLRDIFLTYSFAYHNRSATTFNPKKNYINMKFCADNFPESMDTSIVWDNLDTDNEKITSFIYYLLHPWEGVQYVTTLVKNKLSGILVGFHEDIVGGTDSNSSTGMTKYLGFTGYVTSPSLREIDWIDSLLTNYQNMVVYLIIAMCIIICCYLITGQMRPGRAVLGVIFFAVMALLPPAALNFAADKVNLVCDTLYSGKFDYWSYSQMENYLSQLSDVNSGATTDYMLQLMDLETNSERSAGIGFSGVRLKWMSPKKIHTGTKANDELNNALAEDFSTLYIGILANAVTSNERAEDYSESVGATYLYRDIADIFMYAANSYNLYTTFNGDKPIYAVGEANSNAWDPTAEYPLGELTYSSGETIGEYVMPNYFDDSYEGEDIYSITSSNMAVAYGFLHDTSVERKRSAGNYYTTVSDVEAGEASAEAGTYNPTVDTYIRQEGGLALGLPLAFSETYGKIHENYMQLQYDLEDWDTDDSISMDLDSLEDHIYGLNPHTFDLSLNTIRGNANSNGTSSTNTDTDEDTESEGDGDVMNRETLSGFYYALYAESPYYFFNNHFRDYVVSHHPDYAFSYPIQSRNTNLYRLFLENQQEYFFNYAATAGDGYGELRDFMGMHDLFYYIIPLLSEGNKIADVFDDNFGMYVSEDTQLQITPAGRIRYGGKEFKTFEALINAIKSHDAGVRNLRDEDGVIQKNEFEDLTAEQRYNLWHDYNVWTIFQSYVPWVDTMEDCGYAKPETIRVAGERFEVTNPLDPTCYYKLDGDEISEGRLMVFSRSEMAFYGLTMNDLTSVEQKIIQTQDNVYKEALDIMNYYTLSDEVLINAFSMIQVFEFNKMFSQDSVFGQGYIMYPQGYEAKAFTYDAYLRLVVAQASNEPLQVDSSSEDISIYRRILKNTSIFFGVALLVNDFMAVYIIPVMKVAILILLFFTSIFLIIGAAIKIELQPIKTIWESLLAPLGSYVLICTGFAWIVSLFMSNGAEGVVKTSTGIRVGDPTTVVLLMIFIHVIVVILLFKVCKKCFKDFKTSLLSVADSITATAVGAAAVIGSTLTGSRLRKARGTENGQPGGMPSTASQRGSQNTSGFGAAFGGAMGGAAALGLGQAMPNMTSDAMDRMRTEDQRYKDKKGMNKFDAKAYDKAAAKDDKLKGKEDKHWKKMAQAEYRQQNGSGKGVTDRQWKRAQKLEDKRKSAQDYAKNLSQGGRLYAEKQRAYNTLSNAKQKVVSAGTTARNASLKVAGAVGSYERATQHPIQTAGRAATALKAKAQTGITNVKTAGGRVVNGAINKKNNMVNSFRTYSSDLKSAYNGRPANA